MAQSRERQEQIGAFFRHRGWNPELIFLEASLYKVDRILRQLLAISEKYPDCAMDVTGGSDAELFAAGLFAAKANVRVFTYSRRKNRFYNISGADFADNLPCNKQVLMFSGPPNISAPMDILKAFCIPVYGSLTACRN